MYLQTKGCLASSQQKRKKRNVQYLVPTPLFFKICKILKHSGNRQLHCICLPFRIKFNLCINKFWNDSIITSVALSRSIFFNNPEITVHDGRAYIIASVQFLQKQSLSHESVSTV